MDTFDRDMFVDNHQVAQLETSDWQVVFGRRGTGKITLHDAFKDHVASTNANAHCILIDMRECIASASGLTRQAETDLNFSFDYFYEFICRFARRLVDECLDTDPTSPFGRLVRLLRLRHRERRDEIL